MPLALPTFAPLLREASISFCHALLLFVYRRLGKFISTPRRIDLRRQATGLRQHKLQEPSNFYCLPGRAGGPLLVASSGTRTPKEQVHPKLTTPVWRSGSSPVPPSPRC